LYRIRFQFVSSSPARRLTFGFISARRPHPRPVVSIMSSPNSNDQLQSYVQQLVQQQIQQIQQQTQQQIQHLKQEYEVKLARQSTSSTSNLKPSKPSTFNGDRRVNAEIWLLELENYFNVTGITDSTQRVSFAISQLRENAVVWWKYVLKQRSPVEQNTLQEDWNQFKNEIMKNYRPVEAAETARAALHRIKQTGSVAQYCDTFLRHLNHVDTMDVKDQLFLFKDGLQHHIAREVNIQHPETLNEAMSYATRAEVEHRMYNNRTGRVPFRGPPNHFYRGANASGSASSTPMELGNIETERDAGQTYMYDSDNQTETYATTNETSEQTVNSINHGRFQPRFNVRNTFTKNNRVPGLTKQMYEEYRRTGACFACGKTGHLKHQCTHKDSKN
jgi:hypothetical protein